jgi:hypothetical protein
MHTRPVDLVARASVCEDADALRDPAVHTRADVAATPQNRCPLFDECNRGNLLGPGKLQCIPRLSMEVARFAQTGARTVRAEMRDFATAPIFPPTVQGFIDPYANPDDPKRAITGKPEILSKVQTWAETILYGEPVPEPNLSGHCKDHEQFQRGCSACGMARLVRDDQTDVVYPNGRATRVPRDRCRCPILRVGDFCPVHGG